ncbi:hypothetical protein OFAG_02140 [Oxalobacter formigenes HOxBLS]|uniref:Uncharacterized protein n=1 Tax=Oxalobacter paraformigenes TaxID=556268 RepID=T5LTD4_9BURK|nr:hypothetical protein OFAG_02140 [Oxalobacter paraformigenes]
MNKLFTKVQNGLLSRFSSNRTGIYPEKALNQYGLTLVISGSHEQKRKTSA